MASRLRRSLLMVRAAPTGSLAMVKASTGVWSSEKIVAVLVRCEKAYGSAVTVEWKS
jgi:hypothetical protein